MKTRNLQTGRINKKVGFFVGCWVW